MMGRDPYRRHLRRARRAWRHRDDAYPLLILGPDEPLALLALAAVGRWLFRHRSALAPFAVAIAALITAMALHAHHARSWIPVTVLTAVMTLLLTLPYLPVLHRHPAARRAADTLARLWQVCGIDRPVERGYAGVVVAVTGVWLAAAIALGPTSTPLPAVAFIATVVVGIPWWAHRRRRARVRVERTIAAWPNVAERIGLPGSHIASVLVDAWGFTARVILRRGTSTEQALSKTAAIESGLALRPGSVRVFSDPARADRVILRVVETDPHAHPITWPGSSVTSITQPIELGVSDDGRRVTVVILRRHVLVGGIAGAGKSGVLNVILANLVACADVVIWGWT